MVVRSPDLCMVHTYWLSGMKLLGEALGPGIRTLLPYLQMSSSLMFLGCSFLSPQLPSLYLYQQSWHHAPFSLFHLLYHVESSPLGYRLSRSCCGRQSHQSGLARMHGHWQDAARKHTLIQFRNIENVSWHWSVPSGSGSLFPVYCGLCVIFSTLIGPCCY